MHQLTFPRVIALTFFSASMAASRHIIQFHFKVYTNRQQGARGRGKQLNTNDLYRAFREIV
jgi:hypothetical protein